VSAKQLKAELSERQTRVAAARSRAAALHLERLESTIRDRDASLLGRSAMAAHAVEAWGPAALERSVLAWLAESRTAASHLGSIVELRFHYELRELQIDCELPSRAVVPDAASFRYVKTRDVIEPIARPRSEVRSVYADLIARVALRTIRETLDCTPAFLVTDVVFNGYVSAVNAATGKDIRPAS
jgi:hypothetical protein